MNDVRNLFRGLAGMCGLLLAQLCLHLVRRTYALPGLDVADIRTWLETTEITVIVLSIARTCTMLAIWYVLATTLLCAIAMRSRYQLVARLLRRVSLPATRTLAVRLAGISMISSLAIPPIAAHASADHTEIPTLRHLLPNEQAPVFVTTTAKPATEPPVAQKQSSAVATIDRVQHTVQQGENFWTIAHDQLRRSLQREPTETEIVTYWRALVKTNQHVLANAKNPDLIFNGQVIQLPDVAQ